jgi:hypothetical protein
MANPLAMQLLRQSLGSGGCCDGSALLGGAMPRNPNIIKAKLSPQDKATQQAQRLQNGFLNSKGTFVTPQRYAEILLNAQDPVKKAQRVAQAQAKRRANAQQLYDWAQRQATSPSKLDLCMQKCRISQENKTRARAYNVPLHVRNNPAYQQAKAQINQDQRALRALAKTL